MMVREQSLSEHAKNVLSWREYFVRLEEDRFFEIMRMYLGEIKTPYNKQKLIENLEGFFRNRENLTTIKSFLSDQELEIISAIIFIPDATEDKLVSFFDGTYTYSFLYEILENLEERLIVYRRYQSDGFKNVPSVYKLNPHLESALSDLINISRLLPQIKFSKSASDRTLISPEFIFCFISYAIEYPNMAKQDGTLKKYTMENAEQFFGKDIDRLQILYSAFLNIGIFKDNGKNINIDWSKLNRFAELSFVEQAAYIVVASQGHFSRTALWTQAQIFIDTLKNLGNEFFTRELFLRTGFLVSAQPQKEVEEEGGSRFARILREGRQKIGSDSAAGGAARGAGNHAGNAALSMTAAGGIERCFDAALTLGIILKSGIAEESRSKKDGALKDVYKVSEIFDLRFKDSSALKEMLSIETAMQVSLMPGFELKDFIDLMKFLTLKRFDTVSTFAITRKGIMNGFDAGLDSEKITQILKERTLYDVPESLVIQIDEWSKSYSSASFYKGFVLKLDGKAALLAEHNSVLSEHIHTVIAPGVYLLDVDNDEEAVQILKESSLDFIGRVKTASSENQSAGFGKLDLKGKILNDKTGLESPKEIVERRDVQSIEEKLYEALKSLDIDEQQRESLELRIEHKVIVNTSQLNTSILRLERVNASGMDFSGKIYVIEQAYKNHELIEMKFGNDDIIVRGYPVGIQPRKDNDTTVHIHLEKENIVREYSIGKAKSVRRIRNSIYGK
ncbi:MAG: helicase-associated domain-containing protein [Treponema sp.]|nr:helicase-associated domain-containing protein [Treponema sp.]